MIGINLCQPMRTARVEFQNGIADLSYRQLRRSGERDDLIIVAMDEQHQLVDGLVDGVVQLEYS